ncbi:hypothetical protein GGQ99_004867 [Aminobacter niigataensis]|uniref:DUF6969 domain-containing protein n=2 Tax=Aminobacter niigataensis TaxID=83265 RepID=A0ABR6L913_9HYPH|nr:hypothetical protein [Aminobacter niigataensis]
MCSSVTVRCGFAVFGRFALRCSGSLCGGVSVCSRRPLRGRVPLCGSISVRCSRTLFCCLAMLGGSCSGGSFALRRSAGSLALCCRAGCITMRCRSRSLALRGPAAIGQAAAWRPTMDETRSEAARQALFCEQVLAKSGSNVLLETLREAKSVAAWEHFPPGDVFDPETGAQWYYHSHPPQEGQAEHGHFHCFVRPDGANGPIHHLVAVGVDAYGKLVRLFTVNQWVVGDNWLEAEGTVALLPRFDLHFARPSYLVNRWLAAVLALYADEIKILIRERDKVLAGHRPEGGAPAREDRALEVTSERGVDLRQMAAGLGV